MANSNANWCRWTEVDDNYLRQHYQASSNESLATALHRTKDSVINRLKKLNLSRTIFQCTVIRGNAWTEVELQYLRDSWSNQTIRQMAVHLGRRMKAIDQKRKKLGLHKSKEEIKTVMRKARLKATKRFVPWQEDEIQYLRDHFASASSQELAGKLGRSVYSVIQKARKLGMNLPERRYTTPKVVESAMKKFTPEEDQFIIENWGKSTTWKLSKMLNRDRSSIQYAGKRLGLISDNSPLKPSYHNTTPPRHVDLWSEEDIKYLCDNWSTKSSRVIAEFLNRTQIGVQQKAKRLGLVRTEQEKELFQLDPSSMPDTWVADRITRDQNEFTALLNHPELLDIKRHQMILKRVVRKQNIGQL